MTRPRQSKTANSRSPASGLLACGHPAGQNNLIDGKCGTCRTAAELEDMARTSTGKIAEILKELAKHFRLGKIVYDRNGKSMLEWEKYFNKRKQANAALSGAKEKP